MTNEQIAAVAAKQRAFYDSGATLPVAYRIAALKKLRQAVRDNETAIAEALRADLGKSRSESYMCETGMVLSEISYLLRHIRRFAKEKTVATPLAQFASRSYRKPTPYGVTLIMSPWNYPVLLTLDPLADALAAGNTAVLKPSAYAPATSALLKKLIADCFPAEYVAVVTGGRAENTCLLEQKFDCIFFTGSKAVGKTVLEKAAAHLTPVILELGGKSPCIVHGSADIELTAKRIVFGKFLNCGQTCVAPDYILCDSKVKDRLIECLKAEIVGRFGTALENDAYGKIITRRHFDRITALYLFAEDKAVIREITERCAFGGGCVNDVVIHLATSNMGFGGVGESGMGAYHGKVGFDAFTHYKSIVDKKTWLDLPMRYQPYGKRNDWLIKLFLR